MININFNNWNSNILILIIGNNGKDLFKFGKSYDFVTQLDTHNNMFDLMYLIISNKLKINLKMR